MAHLIKKMATVGLMAAGLAACGDDNNNIAAPPPAPPPVVITPPPPPLEDGFSAAFGTAFRANMNTDPLRDPVPADLPPLSLTTEPVPI